MGNLADNGVVFSGTVGRWDGGTVGRSLIYCLTVLLSYRITVLLRPHLSATWRKCQILGKKSLVSISPPRDTFAMNRLIQRTITITIVEHWCFFWPEAPTAALPATERTIATDATLATADASTTGQLFSVLEVCRIASSTVQTISSTPAVLPTIEAEAIEAKEVD